MEGPHWEVDATALARQVELNLLVPLELCRQAIPRMLERYGLRGLPVGITTVLVGGVSTDMLAAGETYPPFHEAFERLRRLRLVPDTPAEVLAAAVVRGVQRGARTVYLPRRAFPFVAAVEAPAAGRRAGTRRGPAASLTNRAAGVRPLCSSRPRPHPPRRSPMPKLMSTALGATILALVAAGCAGGDTSDADVEVRIADQLTERGLDAEAATCFAEILVDEVGADELRDVDFSAEEPPRALAEELAAAAITASADCDIDASDLDRG